MGGKKETSAAAEGTMPELTPLEVEISLICLRFFRGEWDMYLDYLDGGRVPEPQRRQEHPTVEKLRDLDLRTEYLTLFLEDEIVAGLGTLPFSRLLHLWELSILFNPENDPFRQEAGEAAAGKGEPDEGGTLEAPPTLH